MHRRELLKKCVSLPIVAALAGCSDSTVQGDTADPDSDGDGVPDRLDDYPRDSNRSQFVDSISDGDELNEDYYMAYDFTLSQPATLDYTVDVEGNLPLDVIVTDGTNFRYFEDDADWKYVAELSDMETVHASADGILDSGEWVIIIDNTSSGRASPPSNFNNDRVSYSIDMEIYR